MEKEKWNFEEIFYRFRYPALFVLLGIIVITAGIFLVKSGSFLPKTKVEVLENTTDQKGTELTAEIAGEVINPGVYKLAAGGRVEDLLVLSGGLSGNADRDWTAKYLNRAAKLTDGQKIYIPSFDSAQDSHSKVLSAKNEGGGQSVSGDFSSDSKALININSADLKSLDSLPGIGPTYAQNIIEHRPYSNVSELASKGVLKPSVYEKIKNLVTAY